LHIVFFGMPERKPGEKASEEERAMKQFEILETAAFFRDQNRTPARLHSGIRNADKLTQECKEALLPQFPYLRDGKLVGRLEASIRDTEAGLKPSPLLARGVYDFWGLRGPQSLQLWPGDRVLIQARRSEKGGKFELYLPEYGFEVSQQKGRP